MSFFKSLLAYITVAFLTLPAMCDEAKPQVEVRLLDSRRVSITGIKFPSDGLVLVELNSASPHASVSCKSEFTRVAYPKSGTFEVDVYLDPKAKCTIKCGPQKDEKFMVSAMVWDTKVKTDPVFFPCSKN